MAKVLFIDYIINNVEKIQLVPLSAPWPLVIKRQEVHIWQISLANPAFNLTELRRLLSFDERKRSDRFFYDKDRNYYIAAHGSMRLILEKYLRTDPEKISIINRNGGKPGITSPTNLEFNLSHSGDWALLSVIIDQPIGIDIEKIRPDFDFESLSQHHLHPEQVKLLLTTPRDRRVNLFFQFWTRKEAFLKAKGQGLCSPSTRITNGENFWSIFSLAIIEGYASALVVNGKIKNIQCYKLL